ncbi:GNAT family N-acetyltransferase [Candidatus Woesebacteria bacterium]|nr:GNAT family N-acetyltransferase [Candidatus Woesebacteria bacterium]
MRSVNLLSPDYAITRFLRERLLAVDVVVNYIFNSITYKPSDDQNLLIRAVHLSELRKHPRYLRRVTQILKDVQALDQQELVTLALRDEAKLGNVVIALSRKGKDKVLGHDEIYRVVTTYDIPFFYIDSGHYPIGDDLKLFAAIVSGNYPYVMNHLSAELASRVQQPTVRVRIFVAGLLSRPIGWMKTHFVLRFGGPNSPDYIQNLVIQTPSQIVQDIFIEVMRENGIMRSTSGHAGQLIQRIQKIKQTLGSQDFIDQDTQTDLSSTIQSALEKIFIISAWDQKYLVQISSLLQAKVGGLKLSFKEKSLVTGANRSYFADVTYGVGAKGIHIDNTGSLIDQQTGEVVLDQETVDAMQAVNTLLRSHNIEPYLTRSEGGLQGVVNERIVFLVNLERLLDVTNTLARIRALVSTADEANTKLGTSPSSRALRAHTNKIKSIRQQIDALIMETYPDFTSEELRQWKIDHGDIEQHLLGVASGMLRQPDLIATNPVGNVVAGGPYESAQAYINRLRDAKQAASVQSVRRLFQHPLQWFADFRRAYAEQAIVINRAFDTIHAFSEVDGRSSNNFKLLGFIPVPWYWEVNGNQIANPIRGFIEPARIGTAKLVLTLGAMINKTDTTKFWLTWTDRPRERIRIGSNGDVWVVPDYTRGYAIEPTLLREGASYVMSTSLATVQKGTDLLINTIASEVTALNTLIANGQYHDKSTYTFMVQDANEQYRIYQIPRLHVFKDGERVPLTPEELVVALQVQLSQKDSGVVVPDDVIARLEDIGDNGTHRVGEAVALPRGTDKFIVDAINQLDDIYSVRDIAGGDRILPDNDSSIRTFGTIARSHMRINEGSINRKVSDMAQEALSVMEKYDARLEEIPDTYSFMAVDKPSAESAHHYLLYTIPRVKKVDNNGVLESKPLSKEELLDEITKALNDPKAAEELNNRDYLVAYSQVFKGDIYPFKNRGPVINIVGKQQYFVNLDYKSAHTWIDAGDVNEFLTSVVSSRLLKTRVNLGDVDSPQSTLMPPIGQIAKPKADDHALQISIPIAAFEQAFSQAKKDEAGKRANLPTADVALISSLSQVLNMPVGMFLDAVLNDGKLDPRNLAPRPIFANKVMSPNALDLLRNEQADARAGHGMMVGFAVGVDDPPIIHWIIKHVFGWLLPEQDFFRPKLMYSRIVTSGAFSTAIVGEEREAGIVLGAIKHPSEFVVTLRLGKNADKKVVKAFNNLKNDTYTPADPVVMENAMVELLERNSDPTYFVKQLLASFDAPANQIITPLRNSWINVLIRAQRNTTGTMLATDLTARVPRKEIEDLIEKALLRRMRMPIRRAQEIVQSQEVSVLLDQYIEGIVMEVGYRRALVKEYAANAPTIISDTGDVPSPLLVAKGAPIEMADRQYAQEGISISESASTQYRANERRRQYQFTEGSQTIQFLQSEAESERISVVQGGRNVQYWDPEEGDFGAWMTPTIRDANGYPVLDRDAFIRFSPNGVIYQFQLVQKYDDMRDTQTFDPYLIRYVPSGFNINAQAIQAEDVSETLPPVEQAPVATEKEVLSDEKRAVIALYSNQWKMLDRAISELRRRKGGDTTVEDFLALPINGSTVFLQARSEIVLRLLGISGLNRQEEMNEVTKNALYIIFGERIWPAVNEAEPPRTVQPAVVPQEPLMTQIRRINGQVAGYVLAALAAISLIVVVGLQQMHIIGPAPALPTSTPYVFSTTSTSIPTESHIFTIEPSVTALPETEVPVTSTNIPTQTSVPATPPEAVELKAIPEDIQSQIEAYTILSVDPNVAANLDKVLDDKGIVLDTTSKDLEKNPAGIIRTTILNEKYVPESKQMSFWRFLAAVGADHIFPYIPSEVPKASYQNPADYTNRGFTLFEWMYPFGFNGRGDIFDGWRKFANEPKARVMTPYTRMYIGDDVSFKDLEIGTLYGTSSQDEHDTKYEWIFGVVDGPQYDGRGEEFFHFVWMDNEGEIHDEWLDETGLYLQVGIPFDRWVMIKRAPEVKTQGGVVAPAAFAAIIRAFGAVQGMLNASGLRVGTLSDQVKRQVADLVNRKTDDCGIGGAGAGLIKLAFAQSQTYCISLGAGEYVEQRRPVGDQPSIRKLPDSGFYRIYPTKEKASAAASIGDKNTDTRYQFDKDHRISRVPSDYVILLYDTAGKPTATIQAASVMRQLEQTTAAAFEAKEVTIAQAALPEERNQDLVIPPPSHGMPFGWSRTTSGMNVSYILPNGAVITIDGVNNQEGYTREQLLQAYDDRAFAIAKLVEGFDPSDSVKYPSAKNRITALNAFIVQYQNTLKDQKNAPNSSVSISIPYRDSTKELRMLDYHIGEHYSLYVTQKDDSVTGGKLLEFHVPVEFTLDQAKGIFATLSRDEQGRDAKQQFANFLLDSEYGFKAEQDAYIYFAWSKLSETERALYQRNGGSNRELSAQTITDPSAVPNVVDRAVYPKSRFLNGTKGFWSVINTQERKNIIASILQTAKNPTDARTNIVAQLYVWGATSAEIGDDVQFQIIFGNDDPAFVQKAQQLSTKVTAAPVDSDTDAVIKSVDTTIGPALVAIDERKSGLELRLITNGLKLLKNGILVDSKSVSISIGDQVGVEGSDVVYEIDLDIKTGNIHLRDTRALPEFFPRNVQIEEEQADTSDESKLIPIALVAGRNDETGSLIAPAKNKNLLDLVKVFIRRASPDAKKLFITIGNRTTTSFDSDQLVNTFVNLPNLETDVWYPIGYRSGNEDFELGRIKLLRGGENPEVEVRIPPTEEGVDAILNPPFVTRFFNMITSGPFSVRNGFINEPILIRGLGNMFGNTAFERWMAEIRANVSRISTIVNNWIMQVVRGVVERMSVQPEQDSPDALPTGEALNDGEQAMSSGASNEPPEDGNPSGSQSNSNEPENNGSSTQNTNASNQTPDTELLVIQGELSLLGVGIPVLIDTPADELVEKLPITQDQVIAISPDVFAKTRTGSRPFIIGGIGSLADLVLPVGDLGGVRLSVALENGKWVLNGIKGITIDGARVESQVVLGAGDVHTLILNGKYQIQLQIPPENNVLFISRVDENPNQTLVSVGTAQANTEQVVVSQDSILSVGSSVEIYSMTQGTHEGGKILGSFAGEDGEYWRILTDKNAIVVLLKNQVKPIGFIPEAPQLSEALREVYTPLPDSLNELGAIVNAARDRILADVTARVTGSTYSELEVKDALVWRMLDEVRGSQSLSMRDAIIHAPSVANDLLRVMRDISPKDMESVIARAKTIPVTRVWQEKGITYAEGFIGSSSMQGVTSVKGTPILYGIQLSAEQQRVFSSSVDQAAYIQRLISTMPEVMLMVPGAGMTRGSETPAFDSLLSTGVKGARVVIAVSLGGLEGTNREGVSSGHIENAIQLRETIRALHTLYGFNEKRLAIIGHDIGGLYVSRLAAEMSGTTDKQQQYWKKMKYVGIEPSSGSPAQVHMLSGFRGWVVRRVIANSALPQFVRVWFLRTNFVRFLGFEQSVLADLSLFTRQIQLLLANTPDGFAVLGKADAYSAGNVAWFVPNSDAVMSRNDLLASAKSANIPLFQVEAGDVSNTESWMQIGETLGRMWAGAKAVDAQVGYSPLRARILTLGLDTKMRTEALDMLDNTTEVKDMRLAQRRSGGKVMPKKPTNSAHSLEASSWKIYSKYLQGDLWEKYATELMSILGNSRLTREAMRTQVVALMKRFDQEASDLFSHARREYVPALIAQITAENIQRPPEELSAVVRAVYDSYMVYGGSGSDAINLIKSIFKGGSNFGTSRENGSDVYSGIDESKGDKLLDLRHPNATAIAKTVILEGYKQMIHVFGIRKISFTLASKTVIQYDDILPELAVYVQQWNIDHPDDPVILAVDAVQTFGRAPLWETFKWMTVPGISAVVHSGSKAAEGPAHAGFLNVTAYGRQFLKPQYQGDALRRADLDIFARLHISDLLRIVGNMRAIRAMWALGENYQLHSPLAKAAADGYYEFFKRFGFNPLQEIGLETEKTLVSMLSWEPDRSIDFKKTIKNWEKSGFIVGGPLEETKEFGVIGRGAVSIGLMESLKNAGITDPEEAKQYVLRELTKIEAELRKGIVYTTTSVLNPSSFQTQSAEQNAQNQSRWQRVWNAVKKWWGDQQVLRIIDPNLARLLNLNARDEAAQVAAQLAPIKLFLESNSQIRSSDLARQLDELILQGLSALEVSPDEQYRFIGEVDALLVPYRKDFLNEFYLKEMKVDIKTERKRIGYAVMTSRFAALGFDFHVDSSLFLYLRTPSQSGRDLVNVVMENDEMTQRPELYVSSYRGSDRSLIPFAEYLKSMKVGDILQESSGISNGSLFAYQKQDNGSFARVRLVAENGYETYRAEPIRAMSLSVGQFWQAVDTALQTKDLDLLIASLKTDPEIARLLRLQHNGVELEGAMRRALQAYVNNPNQNIILTQQDMMLLLVIAAFPPSEHERVTDLVVSLVSNGEVKNGVDQVALLIASGLVPDYFVSNAIADEDLAKKVVEAAGGIRQSELDVRDVFLDLYQKYYGLPVDAKKLLSLNRAIHANRQQTTNVGQISSAYPTYFQRIAMIKGNIVHDEFVPNFRINPETGYPVLSDGSALSDHARIALVQRASREEVEKARKVLEKIRPDGSFLLGHSPTPGDASFSDSLGQDNAVSLLLNFGAYGIWPQYETPAFRRYESAPWIGTFNLVDPHNVSAGRYFENGTAAIIDPHVEHPYVAIDDQETSVYIPPQYLLYIVPTREHAIALRREMERLNRLTYIDTLSLEKRIFTLQDVIDGKFEEYINSNPNEDDDQRPPTPLASPSVDQVSTIKQTSDLSIDQSKISITPQLEETGKHFLSAVTTMLQSRPQTLILTGDSGVRQKAVIIIIGKILGISEANMPKFVLMPTRGPKGIIGPNTIAYKVIPEIWIDTTRDQVALKLETDPTNQDLLNLQRLLAPSEPVVDGALRTALMQYYYPEILTELGRSASIAVLSEVYITGGSLREYNNFYEQLGVLDKVQHYVVYATTKPLENNVKVYSLAPKTFNITPESYTRPDGSRGFGVPDKTYDEAFDYGALYKGDQRETEYVIEEFFRSILEGRSPSSIISSAQPAGGSLYAFDQSFVWFMGIMDKLESWIKTRYEAIRMEFSLRNEVVNAKKILTTRMNRKESSFLSIDSSLRNQILNSINTHIDLSLANRLAILRHTVRVLLALDMGAKDPWDKFTEALLPGDYLPMYEQSAIRVSYAFILNNPTDRRSDVTMANHWASSFPLEISVKTPQDIQKLVEAVVAKESIKAKKPEAFIRVLEKLLTELMPTYRYNPNNPSDPINDLVIAKSLPEGVLGNAIGGGTISQQELESDPVWAAAIVFHEKLHQVLMGTRTVDTTIDESQEIVVTSLQYLYLEKAGIATTKLSEVFYWEGSKGLVHMLQVLKDAGRFDWDSEAGHEALYRMSADGDFSEIVNAYSELTSANAKDIIGYFHITTDEVIENWSKNVSQSTSMQQEYARMNAKFGFDVVVTHDVGQTEVTSETDQVVIGESDVSRVVTQEVVNQAEAYVYANNPLAEGEQLMLGIVDYIENQDSEYRALFENGPNIANAMSETRPLLRMQVYETLQQPVLDRIMSYYKKLPIVAAFYGGLMAVGELYFQLMSKAEFYAMIDAFQSIFGNAVDPTFLAWHLPEFATAGLGLSLLYWLSRGMLVIVENFGGITQTKKRVAKLLRGLQLPITTSIAFAVMFIFKTVESMRDGDPSWIDSGDLRAVIGGFVTVYIADMVIKGGMVSEFIGLLKNVFGGLWNKIVSIARNSMMKQSVAVANSITPQVLSTDFNSVFARANKILGDALRFALPMFGIGMGIYFVGTWIQNLSYVDGAYPQFVNQLSHYIGTIATNNYNFWRWQLNDFGFALATTATSFGVARMLTARMLATHPERSKWVNIASTVLVVGLLILGKSIGDPLHPGKFFDLPDWGVYAAGPAFFWGSHWVSQTIKSWRRGVVTILIAGALLGSSVIAGTPTQKAVSAVAQVPIVAQVIDGVEALQNTGCFSVNLLVQRVYASSGTSGQTCLPFFRAPWRVIFEQTRANREQASTIRQIAVGDAEQSIRALLAGDEDYADWLVRIPAFTKKYGEAIRVFQIVEEDQVVGFIMLNDSQEKLQDWQKIFVENNFQNSAADTAKATQFAYMYVKPEMRGKGIGSKSLSELLGTLEEQGIEQVYGHTRYEAPLRLYTSLGAVSIGQSQKNNVIHSYFSFDLRKEETAVPTDHAETLVVEPDEGGGDEAEARLTVAAPAQKDSLFTHLQNSDFWWQTVRRFQLYGPSLVDWRRWFLGFYNESYFFGLIRKVSTDGKTGDAATRLYHALRLSVKNHGNIEDILSLAYTSERMDALTEYATAYRIKYPNYSEYTTLYEQLMTLATMQPDVIRKITLWLPQYPAQHKSYQDENLTSIINLISKAENPDMLVALIPTWFSALPKENSAKILDSLVSYAFDLEDPRMLTTDVVRVGIMELIEAGYDLPRVGTILSDVMSGEVDFLGTIKTISAFTKGLVQQGEFNQEQLISLVRGRLYAGSEVSADTVISQHTQFRDAGLTDDDASRVLTMIYRNQQVLRYPLMLRLVRELQLAGLPADSVANTLIAAFNNNALYELENLDANLAQLKQKEGSYNRIRLTFQTLTLRLFMAHSPREIAVIDHVMANRTLNTETRVLLTTHIGTLLAMSDQHNGTQFSGQEDPAFVEVLQFIDKVEGFLTEQNELLSQSKRQLVSRVTTAKNGIDILLSSLDYLTRVTRDDQLRSIRGIYGMLQRGGISWSDSRNDLDLIFSKRFIDVFGFVTSRPLITVYLALARNEPLTANIFTQNNVAAFGISQTGEAGVEQLRQGVSAIQKRLLIERNIRPEDLESDFAVSLVGIATGFTTVQWSHGKMGIDLRQFVQDFSTQKAANLIPELPVAYQDDVQFPVRAMRATFTQDEGAVFNRYVNRYTLTISGEANQPTIDERSRIAQEVSAIFQAKASEYETLIAEGTHTLVKNQEQLTAEDVIRKSADLESHLQRQMALLNEASLSLVNAKTIIDVYRLLATKYSVLLRTVDGAQEVVTNSLIREVIKEYPEVKDKVADFRGNGITLYGVNQLIEIKNVIIKDHILGSLTLKEKRTLLDLINLKSLEEAKKRAEGTSDGYIVRAFATKGILGEMAGDLGDACYTRECNIMQQKRITGVIFTVNNGTTEELAGSMLLLENTVNGKPVLVMRAINPSPYIDSELNTDDFLRGVISYVQRIAAARGIDTVLVTTVRGALSNRDSIYAAIPSYFTDNELTTLDTPEVFNGYDITGGVRRVRVDDVVIVPQVSVIEENVVQKRTPLQQFIEWIQSFRQKRVNTKESNVVVGVNALRNTGCFSFNPLIKKVYAAGVGGVTCPPVFMSRNALARELRDNTSFRERVQKEITRRTGIRFVFSKKGAGPDGCKFPKCIRADRVLLYMAIYQLASGDWNTRWIAELGKEFMNEYVSEACKPVIYAAFHDIDRGEVDVQMAKEALTALVKGDDACRELQGKWDYNMHYSFVITDVDWEIRKDADGRLLYYTSDPQLIEFLHLDKDGEILPAMIMEPLDRGVIVDFSDWEAVQAAYARLGKSLTDPVYIQYLATNIPDVQLNKLNGIAQPEFLSQINNQTVTPWLVEENGVVRFMTTPNQGISEYDNAMRILWPYDYTTSFIDYSYKGIRILQNLWPKTLCGQISTVVQEISCIWG